MANTTSRRPPGPSSGPEPATAAPLRLEVAHEVPGRLRARCTGLRERPELAAALEALARELPGFETVAVRPRTESVVFRYSLEDTTPPDFRTALGRRAELGDPPAQGTLAAPSTVEPLGAQLIHATRRWWAEADGAVRQSTGGRLDLNTSVPWVLLLLAVRQIARGGSLPALPWYTALYYGLQAILRYPAMPGAAPPDAPEGDDGSDGGGE